MINSSHNLILYCCHVNTHNTVFTCTNAQYNLCSSSLGREALQRLNSARLRATPVSLISGRGLLSRARFLPFSTVNPVKMIDVIQWRASVGLWNCCQCTAGPTRHSIRIEPTPGKKKRKTVSLSLSPLIALLLFILILITGYLEYNPPSTGMNILRSSLQVWPNLLIVHVMLILYSTKFLRTVNLTLNFADFAIFYSVAIFLWNSI